MVIFENIDINIDKTILKNIDIDMAILKNIDIDIDKENLVNIDIDKEILENIDIDKISNRLEVGISNRATQKGWFSFISKEFWAIGIYFDSKSAQHQCHVSTS